tara:strand:- start:514 stop:1020 length:507 start_codon:yes stop_codon:yes gene_type:complete
MEQTNKVSAENHPLMQKYGYSMMLGQQCERSESELLQEKAQYEGLRKTVAAEKQKKDSQLSFIQSQISSIEYGLKHHKMAALRKVKPTSDHIKLLKSMEFLGGWDGSVSIYAEGKRPFGNSGYMKDVARILGWKLPNDDLSDEQYEQANKLLEELPYALNNLLSSLSQ